MIIFKKAIDLQQYISIKKDNGKKIGFVPTMGALHRGHLSLINAAQKEADITVCSIFVNPTQFNDPKDFEKYPVTIKQDIRLLTSCDTDILFLPSVQEMYADGFNNLPHYQLGEIENIFEGQYRPNHFQGVCIVVDKLLRIVQPHTLFLGRKDYQQCMVLNTLIQLIHLPVTISIQPTLRENDGLAMSSRNVRLSADGRSKAAALYCTLLYIKKNAFRQKLSTVLEEAKNRLLENGFEKVDYIVVADATTLQPIAEWNESKELVVLAASFIEGVRLIDNLMLNS